VESGEGVEKAQKQARFVLRFLNCRAGFEQGLLCEICEICG
jgi:hypothetical protein